MFERLKDLVAMSPERVHQMVNDGHTTVIDVNSPQSWSASHVPGAINLDPLGYKEGDLPADKDAVLVFYCSNLMCRKAPNAARRARQMGYRNVHVMPAGITGWVNAKMPTERGA